MRRIAVYGKGGIGKSTTVGNVSAALAGRGLKVIQIGCDPKADSTRMVAGHRIPTVLETMRDNPDPELEDIVFEGRGGVLCVECGGPRPGVGCAGRGIIAAFEQLEELDMIGVYKPDVILYDVLGEHDGYARLGGLIQNSRGVKDEDELVDRAAGEMGTSVIHRLPRDPAVQRCEDRGMTVVQGEPDSDMAASYRELADKLLAASEDSSGGMRFEGE